MRDRTDTGQDVATQALAHIAGDADLCQRFLSSAGIGADQLRAAAGDADFAVFVLDFIAGDDQRLLDFSEAAGLSPMQIMQARTRLAGPGSEGWVAD